MAELGVEENDQPRPVVDEKSRIQQFSMVEELQSTGSTTSVSKPIKKRKKKGRSEAKLGRRDDVLREIEEKAKEQLHGTANEAIDYMRSKWSLDISRVKSTEEMSYRTLGKSVHERPKKYWIQNKRRQKAAEYSGLLANITKPYLPLGAPELDVPLLLLRNLPEAVVIDTTDWILTQIKKEEDRQRKEDELPKLPRRPSVRPTFKKGRINKAAGGSDVIEKLVKDGENFQRVIRGSTTFANVLERWVEERDNEKANRGSAFGMLKVNKSVRKVTSSEAKLYEKYKYGFDPIHRKRELKLDENVYQAEMAVLEKMLLAILDLIKSMLNVTKEQLDSQYRIAEAGITHLRSTSPDVNKRHKKFNLPYIALAKLKKDSSIHSAMNTIISEQEIKKDDKKKFNKNVLRVLRPSKARMQAIQKKYEVKNPFKLYHQVDREVPDTLPIESAQISALHPTIINRDKLAGLSLEINQIFESSTYLEEHVPEIFSTKMHETPLDISRRMEKNKQRFELIFEKATKALPPIWHDVENFQEMLLEQDQPKSLQEMIKSKSHHHHHHHHKKSHLTLTPSVPREESIPTPTLPGIEEPITLDSIEHSRINLLSKLPDAMFQIDQDKNYERLLKVSGVEDSDYSNFRFIMSMKRPFHETERKLQKKVARTIEKFEQDTAARFYAKINIDSNDPVFEASIAKVRKAAIHMQHHHANKKLDDEEKEGKVPEKWFRELVDKCESLDAFRHHGCADAIAKIYKYCNLTIYSRPKLLNRLALVVVSLPLNELATARFQHAIRFLLDHLFVTPIEVMKYWLSYRGIPYLF